MKLSPSAKLPKCAAQGSIGYDVSTINTVTIQPGQIAKLATGLAMALPFGMYLHIAPSSSLSLKHQTIKGGVVDSDYQG
jgi:dUTP pyrophosphatase